jgi:hypothetical protein
VTLDFFAPFLALCAPQRPAFWSKRRQIAITHKPHVHRDFRHIEAPSGDGAQVASKQAFSASPETG